MTPEELKQVIAKLRVMQARLRSGGMEWNAKMIGFTITSLECDVGGYWQAVNDGWIK